MDNTFHLLQFSIYSKLMQEMTMDRKWLEHPIAILIGSLFFIYKIIPLQWINLFENNIYLFFCPKINECSVIIPYHTKTYATFGGKTLNKVHYSERFLALNHYLKRKPELSSLIEVMNFENSSCVYECKSEFILLPNNIDKIRICDQKDIYFEVIYDKTENDNSEDKKTNQNISSKIQHKNYIYKLSKINAEDISILYDFIDKCVAKYNQDTQNKCQMIYEYTKYKTDDETDKMCMTFQGSPFISNKTFQNIFFEEKEDVMEYISEFSVHLPEKKKADIIQSYRDLGIPFKKIILLHGSPGCGKSSLIKAIINETGRHCIFVPWSRMKTCAEFCNLFYELIIDRITLCQKDVVYVFEDFDANKNESIKSRENSIQINNLKKELEGEKIKDSFLKHTIENLYSIQNPKPVDDLTLECVLNVLDGIKELHNAILIFTTNDIVSVDPAVIRPGRIDHIIEMKYANKFIIQNILRHFFRNDPLLSYEIPDDIQISPAKVQEICIKYKSNINDAINALCIYVESSKTLSKI